MELTTSQTFYYSNKHHLSVEDVAESLLALQSFIKATPDVLERIIPGLQIQRVDVFVNEIKSGSLLEDLVVKFIWGNQESFDQHVADLRKDLKVDALLANKTLVGAVIGALVIGGGIYVANKMTAQEEQKQTLQAVQNVFIVNGANLSGVDEQKFRSAIQEVLYKNDHLQKDAVKVVKPAKRDAEATIVFNNDPVATIDNKAVRAMPGSALDEAREEEMDDFTDVEIEIRATDLDSNKRGWGAVVPSVSPRRVRMHLDPEIKIYDLLGKQSIRGDITVIYRRDDKGTRFPTLVFLRSIRK